MVDCHFKSLGCPSPASVLVYVPEGCICFDAPMQALCCQHWETIQSEGRIELMAHQQVASEATRKCYICGRPISECNGFVSAEDFLRVLRGEITTITEVREFCGHCDVRLFMKEYDDASN